MARLSFRDRFFSPPVARAMTSASGILAAGAGLAAGTAVGLPVVAAVALGALAWAVRVAVAVPRAPRDERIDPFTLQDPWRTFTREALQAQRRFAEAVRSTRRGPLRDRLAEIGERIEVGVRSCWRIARAGQALADARRAIDVGALEREVAAVRPPGAPAPEPASPAARTIEALEAQVASARRLDHLLADTRDRLRLLDARLDESVTRAIELSVGGERAAAADLGGLSQDVDEVVGEMEALRQALVETDAPPGPP